MHVQVLIFNCGGGSGLICFSTFFTVLNASILSGTTAASIFCRPFSSLLHKTYITEWKRCTCFLSQHGLAPSETKIKDYQMFCLRPLSFRARLAMVLLRVAV